MDMQRQVDQQRLERIAPRQVTPDPPPTFRQRARIAAMVVTDRLRRFGAWASRNTRPQPVRVNVPAPAGTRPTAARTYPTDGGLSPDRRLSLVAEDVRSRLEDARKAELADRHDRARFTRHPLRDAERPVGPTPEQAKRRAAAEEQARKTSEAAREAARARAQRELDELLRESAKSPQPEGTNAYEKVVEPWHGKNGFSMRMKPRRDTRDEAKGRADQSQAPGEAPAPEKSRGATDQQGPVQGASPPPAPQAGPPSPGEEVRATPSPQDMKGFNDTQQYRRQVKPPSRAGQGEQRPTVADQVKRQANSSRRAMEDFTRKYAGPKPPKPSGPRTNPRGPKR
ncbi:MAG: hypothetical protein AB7I30_01265 [Isosphaeraceae bacterium]